MSLDTYQGIALVGRFVSALLDSSLIILVFLITRTVFKSPLAGLLASLVYAAGVLPIQLAHFFAVDTFLVLFLVLSFYLTLKLVSAPVYSPRFLLSFLAGLVFGAALAAKVTALLFLPILAWLLIYAAFKTRYPGRYLVYGLILAAAAFISFRVLQPYLFIGPLSLNPQVLANWQQLKSFDNKQGWFPPAVQWLTTTPWFPVTNLFWWGLGPILGLLAISSVFFAFIHIKKFPWLIPVLLWIIGLFAYQAVQFAKPMRYFYPVYPFLAVISGLFLSRLWPRLKPLPVQIILLVLLLYWPVAFVSIYSRPHSRVAATSWIYSHIPAGSTLSCEHWDDCLPLGGPGPYRILEFPLYDPDTPLKWQRLATRLAQTDYLILSSNRLYGSIMTVPQKYPQTTKFYSDLFAGRLDFVKVAEFTSRPNLPLPGLHFCLTPPPVFYGRIAYSFQECPLPGISFVDDYADESFTVYDHPKVIIFARRPLSGTSR